MPMNWIVEFDDKNQLVLLVYKGLNSASDIYNSSIAAIELSNRMQVIQMLVDARRFKTNCSRKEIFKMPHELYEKWGADKNMQTAVIEPRDLGGRQIASFYELSTNRLGWKTKVVKDRKFALKWLKGL